nr:unnamed protein product [Mus musculus]
MEVAQHADRDRLPWRRWLLPVLGVECSGRDLTTRTQNHSSEEGLQNEKRVAVLFSAFLQCPPHPPRHSPSLSPPRGALPSPQAHLPPSGGKKRRWATHSFPTFDLQQAASGCWASIA